MRILESSLYAENLEECFSFYSEVLEIEVISFDPQRDLFLKLQDSVLIIFRASRTVQHDSIVPPHGCQGAGHIAFESTPEELERWKATLAEKGVPIIKKIDWQNGAKSIYFKDPAGNVLEFATRNLWF
jgi:catechol-2,3-dioxygenase